MGRHGGLLGEGCRDLLVSGKGANRLLGNGGDDILIAGFTDYDESYEILDATMAARAPFVLAT